MGLFAPQVQFDQVHQDLLQGFGQRLQCREPDSGLFLATPHAGSSARHSHEKSFLFIHVPGMQNIGQRPERPSVGAGRE
ncbi:hypothetical protein [Streptomyces sp. NPDC001070]